MIGDGPDADDLRFMEVLDAAKVADCKNCQKLQSLLGKIIAEKLEIFAIENNPVADIINETTLAGFCVKEWCDYFREGNDVYKSDSLSILDLRKDLAEVAAMLRRILDVSTSE